MIKIVSKKQYVIECGLMKTVITPEKKKEPVYQKVVISCGVNKIELENGEMKKQIVY
jgi:hypothetical protein